MVERISDAVADTAPAVREEMNDLAGFKDTGKRMLAAWSEGVNHLRDSRMYGLSPWKSSKAFEGISDPRSWRTHELSLGVRSYWLLAPGSGSASSVTVQPDVGHT